MNRQQGASLLNLLIGLLVSAIVLVGMMMIFRSAVQTAIPASEAARSDGERVSGLLAAHMMLHDAGFGKASPDTSDDLVVLQNAALSAGGALSGSQVSGSAITGNAIVWSKTVEDQDRCEGLLAITQDSESYNIGSLLRLSSSNDCASAGTAWNTLAWTAVPLILEARHREKNDPVREITIDVTEEECRPFGIGSSTPAGGITVRLSYPVNVNDADQAIASTTCLANFPAP